MRPAGFDPDDLPSPAELSEDRERTARELAHAAGKQTVDGVEREFDAIEGRLAAALEPNGAVQAAGAVADDAIEDALARGEQPNADPPAWRLIAQLPDEETYAAAKARIDGLGGTVTAGYPDDGLDDEGRVDEPDRDPPDLDTAGDDKLRRVLELQGFNAVRGEVLHACAVVAGIPPETLDAIVEYQRAAVARLRVNPNPNADAALTVADQHGRYIELVRRWRRELEQLEQRIAAAARITAP